MPSIGILLHEIIKLMYHAKVKDPLFFRIGTCGGIGLEGGTVVISEDAVDEMLNTYHEQASVKLVGTKNCLRPYQIFIGISSDAQCSSSNLFSPARMKNKCLFCGEAIDPLPMICIQI